MEATTLTRAAGSGPLSAAADMPRGKPIETPTAHSTTPASTIQGFPARMNSTTPTTPRAVVTRMVRTRPRRSTMGPPKIRVIASLAAYAAANSTLISTSRVPIPSPTITKAIATSGTEPTMSARPMTASAAVMSSSAAAMARRLPSQCRTGVDPSSPRMAPTVTPARSSPIAAVSMPRPALMAGSRGPHAEMVIPPSPNAAVTDHRHRARAERSVVTIRLRSKTFQWKVSRAPREQALEDRQRAADVDGPGIEEPLDLQAIRRGDHQRRRVQRVDVRCDAAGPLPGLDPGGQRLPQRPEPVAHEFPGDGVPFLQRVGGKCRVE